jgi:hypothetical protein
VTIKGAQQFFDDVWLSGVSNGEWLLVVRVVVKNMIKVLVAPIDTSWNLYLQ